MKIKQLAPQASWCGKQKTAAYDMHSTLLKRLTADCPEHWPSQELRAGTQVPEEMGALLRGLDPDRGDHKQRRDVPSTQAATPFPRRGTALPESARSLRVRTASCEELPDYLVTWWRLGADFCIRWLIYLTLFRFVFQANCNGTVIVLKTQIRNEGVPCIVKAPERAVHSRMWDQTASQNSDPWRWASASSSASAAGTGFPVKLLHLSKHGLPQAASSGLCFTVTTFQSKFLV